MSRQGSRIYWRDQGGERRAYGDFRDLGGKREALIPEGETRATTDPDVAQALCTERVKELASRTRDRVLLGIEEPSSVGTFAAHHLKLKARSGRVSEAHLANMQLHYGRAADFFGAGRELHTIGVRDVERWMHSLATEPNGRGETLSPKTVREHLNSLSNLYRRAQGEAAVPPGFNPVAAVMDKPVARKREAKWLEVPDAALLLEAARLYKPPPGKHGASWMHPLVATALLTGGRKSEILGLVVDDVSFDRRTVTFRPHPHRRLKSRTSHRAVPLWPQLEEILREYIFGGPGPVSGLLFPSGRTGRMVHDARKALDAIGERAGFAEGEVRMHRFRHTYCAARLQTLDAGAPVSEFTVMRELGHSSPTLVRRVYGHLGDVRHRSEVVEYRVEQHRKELGDRLKALREAE